MGVASVASLACLHAHRTRRQANGIESAAAHVLLAGGRQDARWCGQRALEHSLDGVSTDGVSVVTRVHQQRNENERAQPNGVDKG